MIHFDPREYFQAHLASTSTDEQRLHRIEKLRDWLTRHGQHGRALHQQHDDISLGQARSVGDETDRRAGKVGLDFGKP